MNFTLILLEVSSQFQVVASQFQVVSSAITAFNSRSNASANPANYPSSTGLQRD
jgi:hypothetical protein